MLPARKALSTRSAGLFSVGEEGVGLAAPLMPCVVCQLVQMGRLLGR